MPFTPEPPRPLRDLGQVIEEAGGLKRFNRLFNGEAGGPNQSPRTVHRRPRPASSPSRRIPERWRRQPADWED